jgi:hypothetical protein
MFVFVRLNVRNCSNDPTYMGYIRVDLYTYIL